jgi:Flp pilus assembly protein TadB
VRNYQKVAIGIAVVGLILLFFSPIVGLIFIAAAIALPVGAYLMLDPSQRKRLRRNIRGREIGR